MSEIGFYCQISLAWWITKMTSLWWNKIIQVFFYMIQVWMTQVFILKNGLFSLYARSSVFLCEFWALIAFTRSYDVPHRTLWGLLYAVKVFTVYHFPKTLMKLALDLIITMTLLANNGIIIYLAWSGRFLGQLHYRLGRCGQLLMVVVLLLLFKLSWFYE